MSFIDKSDYYSKAILVFIFLGAFYFFKELFDSTILILIGAGIGGMFGFFIVSKLDNKSNKVKLISLIITFFLFIIVIYISTRVISTSNTEVNSDSYVGTWLSDSSDGIIVKLRFNENKGYLSMSPNFEEVEYEYKIENDSLYLSKDGSSKFKWLIKSRTPNFFEIKDARSTVKFYKK